MMRSGCRSRCVTPARSDLALDRRFLSPNAGLFELLALLDALESCSLAFLGRALALVRGPFAPVGQIFAWFATRSRSSAISSVAGDQIAECGVELASAPLARQALRAR